jgi:hypothetical protein
MTAKNRQLLFLLGTRGKRFSFPIRAVNFCKKKCTCSPSSLGQDLTVKNEFFFFFSSFGLLELEKAVLNVFGEKRSMSFRS